MSIFSTTDKTSKLKIYFHKKNFDLNISLEHKVALMSLIGVRFDDILSFVNSFAIKNYKEEYVTSDSLKYELVVAAIKEKNIIMLFSLLRIYCFLTIKQ